MKYLARLALLTSALVGQAGVIFFPGPLWLRCACGLTSTILSMVVGGSLMKEAILDTLHNDM